MVPQEQNEMQEYENMRKQLKVDSNVQSMIGQELYPERQRNRLQIFLQSLKDYAKITAVMIEHQHKSINTLPIQIRDRFPELKERVGNCINCCKKNAQLLQKIKSTLQNKLQLKPSIISQSLNNLQTQTHQCQGQSHEGHSHSHDNFQTNPNKILNIFSHLCRQYSQEQIHKQQRFYVRFVESTVKQFIDKNVEMKENIKTLVVGCGMGRTLVQLKQLFQAQKLPKSSYLIQGHEQDPQYYLLAQYLLNHHPQTQQQVQFYPYIHNFSNHLYQQTPYLPVAIKLPNIGDKYGITFGAFNKLYKSHSEEWNVIVTQFYNYSLTDILLHIQIIYKLLKNKGVWIDISTASFDSHVIPYLSYREYERILDKTQFKLVNKFSQNQLWYQQPNKLMKQWRKVYYRVMTKQR